MEQLFFINQNGSRGASRRLAFIRRRRFVPVRLSFSFSFSFFFVFSFARLFVRASNPGARGIFSRSHPAGPDTFIPVDEQSTRFGYSSPRTCVSGNTRRVVRELLSLRETSCWYSIPEIFPSSLFLSLFPFLFLFSMKQSANDERNFKKF